MDIFRLNPVSDEEEGGVHHKPVKFITRDIARMARAYLRKAFLPMYRLVTLLSTSLSLIS